MYFGRWCWVAGSRRFPFSFQVRSNLLMFCVDIWYCIAHVTSICFKVLKSSIWSTSNVRITHDTPRYDQLGSVTIVVTRLSRLAHEMIVPNFELQRKKPSNWNSKFLIFHFFVFERRAKKWRQNDRRLNNRRIGCGELRYSLFACQFREKENKRRMPRATFQITGSSTAEG